VFATDCDDPLCVVHRDDVDRFAAWPEARPVPEVPAARLREWILSLMPAPGGVVVAAADGEVAAVPDGAGPGVPATARRGLCPVSPAVGAPVLVAGGPHGELGIAAPGCVTVIGCGGDRAGPLAVPGRPAGVAWDPMGRYLAAAYGRTLVLVGIDGTELARFEQLPSAVSAVVCDGARHRIGVVIKKAVVWFDDELQPITVDAVLWDDGLRSAVLSPNGDWLAIGCYGGTTLLWSAGQAEENRSTAGPAGPGELLAWSPDGRLLAVGHDRFVALHDVSDGHGAVPDGTSTPSLLEVPARPSALSWALGPLGDAGDLRLLVGYEAELAEWSVVGEHPSPVPGRRWRFAERVTAVAAVSDRAGAPVIVGLADGSLYLV